MKREKVYVWNLKQGDSVIHKERNGERIVYTVSMNPYTEDNDRYMIGLVTDLSPYEWVVCHKKSDEMYGPNLYPVEVSNETFV